MVRRAFELMATLPFSEVADALNREGAQHRAARAWISNAVKDLWRRHEVYIGKVMTRRGAEVRDGNHEPILDEETRREAVAGVTNRKRAKGKLPPTSKRLYLLCGLVYCSCGTRMHGDARLARGQAWRYYLCPVSEGRRAAFGADGELIECDQRRVPADVAEAFVAAPRAAGARGGDHGRPGGAVTAAPSAPARDGRPRARSGSRPGCSDSATCTAGAIWPRATYRLQVHEVRAQLAQLPGG